MHQVPFLEEFQADERLFLVTFYNCSFYQLSSFEDLVVDVHLDGAEDVHGIS